MDQILFRYLIPIITLVWIQVSGESPCTSANCDGPFMLKTEEMVYNVSNPYVTGARLVSVSSLAKMTTILKRRFTKYCFNGGEMDSNDGCEDWSGALEASIQELKDGCCLVGPTAKPVDFWGSDSDICMDKTLHCVTQQLPQYFNWEGRAPFWRHLCVMDWQCEVHHSNIMIHFSDESGKIATYDRNGEEIALGNYVDDHVIIRKYIGDGFTSLFEYRAHPVEEDIELHCFTKSTHPTYCIVSKSSNLTGTSFMLEGGLYIGPNFIITPHHRVENAALTHTINKLILSSPRMGSASILDLNRATQAVLYHVEELYYDVSVITNKLSRLVNTVNKIINSVSKIDDELIANIIEKPGKIMWRNKDIFMICPCYDTKTSPNSNCNNGYIYLDGRLSRITEENKDKCELFNLDGIKQIGYVGDDKISVSELRFPPPAGTPSTWDGWSWVSQKKEEIIDSTVFVQKNLVSGNILDSLQQNKILNGIGTISAHLVITGLNSIFLIYVFCCPRRV